MDLTGLFDRGGPAQNQPWSALSTVHGLGEIGEELVGQFLGRAVDQALAELGELAADLGLDVIAQQGTAILFGERHGGAALGKAGDAALAFARDLVAIGWIEVAQIDLALEAGGDRPDLHFGRGAEAVSSVFSSSSQPGMQAFSTSGSFSLAHTASRAAASWTSPFIVMAIGVPPGSP